MSSPTRQTRKKVESSRLKYFLSESLSDSRCCRRLLSALNPMKIGWWIRSSSISPLPLQNLPCGSAESGRLRQADVARSWAFNVRLAVEGDVLSLAQGIECD